MIKNFIRLIRYYTKNKLIIFMLLIPLKKILRRFYSPHINCNDFLSKVIIGKKGLEIGGPSPIFSKNGLCPVYGIIKNIDNLNYSEKTLWNESKGESFYYDKINLGTQIIGEAYDIKKIIDLKYDFVCSSHFIQHCTNPIKVLQGIKHILKDEGILLFIVPYKNNTFDHKREITELQHMVDDYEMDIGEDDNTHINEIIKNHDLSRDDGVSDYNSFVNRCKNNFVIRGCHNHVFNEHNFIELLDYLKFNINKVELWYPYHMIFICSKNDNKFEKLNIQEFVNLKINGPWFLKPNYPIL